MKLTNEHYYKVSGNYSLAFSFKTTTYLIENWELARQQYSMYPMQIINEPQDVWPLLKCSRSKAPEILSDAKSKSSFKALKRQYLKCPQDDDISSDKLKQ